MAPQTVEFGAKVALLSGLVILSPIGASMTICAGGYDLLAELVCTDDEHLLKPAQRPDPGDRRGHHHRDVRLSQARQADLRMGDPMSDDRRPTQPCSSAAARDHLWMHFTRLSSYAGRARCR